MKNNSDKFSNISYLPTIDKENFTSRKLYFRKDIAAYRAFAVLLVVLNHFEFKGFRFGFVGVDIFFVISGYVITRQLLHEYVESARFYNSKRGNISLVNFYIRRFRRIFPLATTVIVVTLLISKALENEAKFKLILNDAIWALSSLANIHFMKENSNYFGQDISKSPLLHYWSLSVEEQFYFIWPILFIVAASWFGMKNNKRHIHFLERLLFLFVSLFAISILAYLQTCFTDINRAYFSSLTRIWELSAGGICAILSNIVITKSKIKLIKICRLASFCIMFILLPFISKSNIVFTIPVLVICFSVILITQSHKSLHDTKYGRFLSNRIFQKIGELSYGIYLWHWSIYIIFLSRHPNNNITIKITLVIISIVLSWITNILIEKPLRSRKIIQLIPPFEKPDIRFKFYLDQKFRSSIMLIFSIILLVFINFKIDVFFSGFSNRFYTTTTAIESFAAVKVDESAITNSFVTPTGQNISQDTTTLTSNEVYLDGISKDIERASTNLNISNSQKIRITGAMRDGGSKVIGSACDNTKNPVPSESCSFGSNDVNAPVILILGDSKAGAIRPIFLEYFKDSRYRVFDWSMPGCKLIYSNFVNPEKLEATFAPGCAARRNWIKQNINLYKPKIILLSEYPPVREDVGPDIKYLQNFQQTTGAEIIYILNNGSTKPISDCLNPDLSLIKTCISYNDYSRAQLNTTIASFSMAGFKTLDFNQFICSKSGICPPIVNDIFTTTDSSHMSRKWATYIYPAVKLLLDSVIP